MREKKKAFTEAEVEVIRFEKDSDVITGSTNYVIGSGEGMIDEGDDNE